VTGQRIDNVGVARGYAGGVTQNAHPLAAEAGGKPFEKYVEAKTSHRRAHPGIQGAHAVRRTTCAHGNIEAQK
jgi:hypothetical protein